MRDHPGQPPSQRREPSTFHGMPERNVPATSIERVETSDGVLSRVPETDDDLARLGRDRSLRHYAGMIERPGVMFFATYLEYTFYPPSDRSRNNRFMFRVIDWEGITFVVTTIPDVDRVRAEQAANRAELLIKDGVPSAITADGIAFFPLSNPNVFTLESRPGAPVYRGQNNVKLALAMEQEECDEIVDQYRQAFLARGEK